jgi:hypothetical protein
MSRTVLRDFDLAQKKLKERAKKDLPDFLKDIEGVVERFPGMSDDQKLLTKKFFNRDKEDLVLNVDAKSIAILVLPGGLPHDMRRELSQKLEPLFKAFNESFKD